jgi:amino acid transporter
VTRPVGPLQLLALGVNGIVGVGIFFAPAGIAASAPGFGPIWAFAGTALALVPVAFAFAALGRRFDEDGGPVVFARAAFGDAVAFMVGWVAYVSAFLSTTAVMAGLAAALAASAGLAGGGVRRALAMALVTGIALLVASGIRLSAWTWTTLTVLKLLPLAALLAAFAAFGGPWPGPAPAAAAPDWARAGLAATFALQGFEIVPVVAGQARRSDRAVPLATVGSLLSCGLLYVGLAAACVLALPGLASSPAPLAEAAAVYGGPGLGRLVAFGTNVSALGICFGMMVTTPRYLSALAAGGRRSFGLDAQSARGVPVRALAVTWLIVLAFVNAGELSELFALSGIAVLVQFGVTALALAALARRRERGLHPALAALAPPCLAVAAALVALGSTRREAWVAGATLAAGAALYALVPARAPRGASLY